MKKLLFLLIAILGLVSCEKFDLPLDSLEYSSKSHPYEVKVNINSITRSTVNTNIEGISRLSFGLFDNKGDKLYGKNQTQGEGFGNISFAVDPGEYKLITIGHNGEGNSTISTLEKVTFYNSKVTDTFYDTTKIIISDASVTKNLILKRPVSKIQITNTGKSVSSEYKFYYTGGSSTFNPISGYGCVNSRQTEYRDSARVYNIYTFPHQDRDLIKLIIYAKINGDWVEQKTITDIPVERNKITTIEGDLSDTSVGIGSSGIDIGITLDTEWNGYVSF